MTIAPSPPLPDEPAPAWGAPRPVNLLQNSFSEPSGLCRPAIRPSEGIAVYTARQEEYREHGDIKSLKPVVVQARQFTPDTIVCGGWNFDDGLDALLAKCDIRSNQITAGHRGLPGRVDCIILGDDEETTVPMRPFTHIFEFDQGEDSIDLRLSPCEVTFCDGYTIVRYDVEGVDG